jgi:hypothetical protein
MQHSDIIVGVEGVGVLSPTINVGFSSDFQRSIDNRWTPTEPEICMDTLCQARVIRFEISPWLGLCHKTASQNVKQLLPAQTEKAWNVNRTLLQKKVYQRATNCELLTHTVRAYFGLYSHEDIKILIHGAVFPMVFLRE